MAQTLLKVLLAFGLVAATPVPATAQGTAASPILHEEAKLLASDGTADDGFGGSAAISGERLIVGASRNDDLGRGSGSAYVFERDDTGTWAEVVKLLASDGEADGQFGSTVAISGERLVVGARGGDDLGFDSGSAYVFERDDTGVWAEVAKLLASDGEALDYFGSSVAISGESLVVGASTEDLGIQSGSAYVFERDGAGTWTEVAKLLASDGAPGDYFGESVAISGEGLVVGAPEVNGPGGNFGSAYVFERDDTGTWTEVAKLLASDGAPTDWFGSSVGRNARKLTHPTLRN